MMEIESKIINLFRNLYSFDYDDYCDNETNYNLLFNKYINIRSLDINFNISNINKLPSTLNKLSYNSNNINDFTKLNINLNNLPLYLHYLYIFDIFNLNNLPPNLIFLSIATGAFIGCSNYEFFNLPRYLKFIMIDFYYQPPIPYEIYDNNFDINKLSFMKKFEYYKLNIIPLIIL